MVALFVLIFLIFAFSLMEYVDRVEWVEMSNNLRENYLFRNKNKAYGAYRLGKQQPILIISLTIGALMACIASIGLFHLELGGEGNLLNEASQLSDTTQFVLNAPDQVLDAPPEHFNFNGNNGDSQPVAQDGAATHEDGEQEDPNSTQPTNQKTQPSDRTSNRKSKTTPEQSIYDFERTIREQTGGDAERARIQKEWDARKKQKEEKDKQKQAVNGGTGGTQGTNAGADGQTLVSWDLDGRKAHLNDKSNVKIPGYTCGKGVNVKVVVKIRVNSNGDVISAKSQAPAGTNPCCVQKAEAYALKSRFEYAPTAIQEGTITYSFKSQ
jgi:outer membrane biosynthesis protein TonB